jgi:hypothetical protein
MSCEQNAGHHNEDSKSFENEAKFKYAATTPTNQN